MPQYYSRYSAFHIEGGDILNINEHTLAIGISQRTEPDAIDEIAHNIFKDETSPVDTILAFNIPNNRAMMHLDTVFTQIDVDKFTIHPGIMGPLTVFEITPEGERHQGQGDLRHARGSSREVRGRARHAYSLRQAATASRPSASSGTTAPTRCASLRVAWWSTSATMSPTRCCEEHGIEVLSRSLRLSSPAAVAAPAA